LSLIVQVSQAYNRTQKHTGPDKCEFGLQADFLSIPCLSQFSYGSLHTLKKPTPYTANDIHTLLISLWRNRKADQHTNRYCPQGTEPNTNRPSASELTWQRNFQPSGVRKSFSADVSQPDVSCNKSQSTSAKWHNTHPHPHTAYR